MPRKKKLRPQPLENPRHEEIAQRLAAGETQYVAYINVYRPELKERVKSLTKPELLSCKHTGGMICRTEEVRERVRAILLEAHEKRLKIKMDDLKVTTGYVTDRLVTLVDRCMQAVPVINGQGNATGMYKFEPNGAVKALELLGLEQGMFERKHKHLHARVNPLSGDRTEIVGRLGVLLEQLSDRDLASIGLQRIGTVEVVAQRVNGLGGQQVPALPAVSQAS